MGPGKLYLDGLAVIVRAEGQMKLATKYGEKLQVPYKQKPKRSVRCQSDTSDTTTMVIEVVDRWLKNGTKDRDRESWTCTNRAHLCRLHRNQLLTSWQ